MKQTDPNAANFPAGLSQPALRALAEAGYTRLEQLTQVREQTLKQLHGMGPKGIGILRQALHERGLTFASETQSKKEETV